MTYEVLFTGNFLKMRFSEFKSYQVTFDSFSSRCKGLREEIIKVELEKSEEIGWKEEKEK